jgi:dihydrofolate reductase
VQSIFFLFRFASCHKEYRLFLNPIVLGGGIPLFQDIKDWMKLKLPNERLRGS